MIELLIEQAIGKFDGQSRVPTAGVPAGLSCLVVLANLFLHELDCFVAHSEPPLDFFGRFMDDLLMVGSLVALAHAEARARSWRKEIAFDHSAPVQKCSFLDLVLSFDSSSDGAVMKFDLYEKVGNAYLYFAWGSCHPASCYRGIFAGGLGRTYQRIVHRDDRQNRFLRFL